MGLRGFLDNARREASSLAAGAFPGYQAIAQQAVNDAGRLLGDDRVQSFGLDDVARTGIQEFKRSTPLLPLLRGDFREAGHRFYERPITGSLDFLGAGSLAGQGLKLTSRAPGALGESSLRLRGYEQLDKSSLGDALTIGQLPSFINKADGTQVPAREYMLRPQLQTHGDNLWARKTMRSPKSSGNTIFDEGVDIGDTLSADPLVDQSVPRAGYEPFAKLGDMFDFGPKIASKRFGKRLAIRNRSRLKTTTQEMMSVFGRTKKEWRKEFGKDADDAVGDAIFLKSMGINSYADLAEAMKRFEDGSSGRQAFLNDKEVDVQSREGKQKVNLSQAEYDLAERFVKQRNAMAERLAERVANLESRGYGVVATGGDREVLLSPEMVKADPDAIYHLIGKGNLHLKRVDTVLEQMRLEPRVSSLTPLPRSSRPPNQKWASASSTRTRASSSPTCPPPLKAAAPSASSTASPSTWTPQLENGWTSPPSTQPCPGPTPTPPRTSPRSRSSTGRPSRTTTSATST